MREFEVKTEAGLRPALDVLADAPEYRARDSAQDLAEYVVSIDWLDTVPAANAVSEAGLFGSQHTVCKPTKPKWSHTVERLKPKFKEWEK